MVAFGGITPILLIFLAGFLVTSVLVIKRVKGALIMGIVFTSLLAFIVSLITQAAGGEAFVTLPEGIFALPSLDVFFKLDIAGALSAGMILPIFSLLFTDMFDSISTFAGVSEVGDFIDKESGEPKNVGKALLVDAIGTTLSGLFGTSSATTYIESAAGVEEGGRSGFAAVVTGLLFIPFMFLSPLLRFIPEVATAPVLVLIGIFMVKPLMKIHWTHFDEAIPAFLGLILIPLTYSITQGVVWAFLSWTILKVLLGKTKEVPVALWVIDAFAILSLVLAN
jgi:AGZA family xanthine/uracil permease-like MFS transporter